MGGCFGKPSLTALFHLIYTKNTNSFKLFNFLDCSIKLKLFFENLKRFFSKKNLFKNNNNCVVIKNQTYSQTTLEKRTSVKQNQLKNKLKKSSKTSLPSIAAEDNYWNDEHYDFEQFHSPHLYLIGDCISIKSSHEFNVQPKLANRDPPFIDNFLENNIGYDNFSKRIFYLNKINQVNVDGFEWDLI